MRIYRSLKLQYTVIHLPLQTHGARGRSGGVRGQEPGCRQNRSYDGTVPDNGIFLLGWKGKQGKILTVLHLGLFFLTLLGGGRGEAVFLEDTVSRSPREAAP